MKYKAVVKTSVIGLTFFIFATYALSVGVFTTTYADALSIIWSWLQGNVGQSINADVVILLRLPRFLAALLIGAGLALTGAVMQAVLKNSLADPYILGVSSGAGLGAICAIILGFTSILGFDSIGFFAFCGALGATVLLIVITKLCGKGNLVAVLLIGMCINVICSAFISLFLSIYADAEKIQNVSFWLMGSMGKISWNHVYMLSVVVLSLGAYLITRHRVLNVMLLGDEVAITLGHDLRNKRQLYIVICALIVGAAVYTVGIIGFIGLLIPHISRTLVGNDHKKLLPMSTAMGACFLAWADVLSRMVIPGREVPIGIMVAVFGAPFFVYLLMKGKYSYEK